MEAPTLWRRNMGVLLRFEEEVPFIPFFRERILLWEGYYYILTFWDLIIKFVGTFSFGIWLAYLWDA